MTNNKILDVDMTKYLDEFCSKRENGEISDEEILSIACSALVLTSFLGYSIDSIAGMVKEQGQKITDSVRNQEEHEGTTITTKGFVD